MWKILMKHNTLKLNAPYKYVGSFIKPKWGKELARVVRAGGFRKEYLEEMVLGTWLWSSNPDDDSTKMITFFAGHTCVLQTSYWDLIEESFGVCYWKLLMKW